MTLVSLPPVFRSPGFRLFWLGVTFSQIGSRATVAANLWQIQELTDSTLAVGVVSLLEGIAILVLAPLGGSLVDRMDRKRLLQLAQVASLLASVELAVLTSLHLITPVWIYLAATVVAAAATVDQPARQTLVPALVPRERLIDAFAVLLPSRQLAVLVGPAIAGLVIALWGAGAVYLFDVVTYVVLVATLARIGFEKMEPQVPQNLWSHIAEGVRFVREKPLIWQLMAVDFAATFFAAYRVLLPALARDTFGVGATGYGLLAAAPAFGAIVGAGASYRLRAFPRKGALVLAVTMLYALCTLVLGYAPLFAVALVLVAGAGLFDAMALTIRQAVTQLETPDRLRGRVTSLYQMVSRGGPALGQAQMGALASALGPPLALTVGAAACLAYAGWLATLGTTVREYEG